MGWVGWLVAVAVAVAVAAAVAVAVAEMSVAPSGLEGGAASPGSACAMRGAKLRGIATLPSPAA